MGNYLEELEKKYKDLNALKSAENELLSNPGNLELRIDILRSYDRFHPGLNKLDEICDSIIWIIENKPEAEAEIVDWVECSIYFLRSDKKEQAIIAFKQSINFSKENDLRILQNAAAFCEILDLDFSIDCFKKVFEKDPSDLLNAYDYAKILIKPKIFRKPSSADIKESYKIFEIVMSFPSDNISLEMASCACRCALLYENKVQLKKWTATLADKVSKKYDHLMEIFVNEGLGILARSYLYLGEDKNFKDILSRLENVPLKYASDLLLFDRDLVQEMKLSGMNYVEYIEKRLSNFDTDSYLKKDYLSLIQT